MKARRDYQVACPVCHAAIGNPCKGKQGERLPGVHFQRSHALRREVCAALKYLYAPARVLILAIFFSDITSHALGSSRTKSLQTAIVLSQQINEDQVDRGLLTGTSLVRYASVVTVQTDTLLMTWREIATFKFGTTTQEVRNPLPLPVHGKVDFYRKGNLCFVKDDSGKRHKFLIVHMEVR